MRCSSTAVFLTLLTCLAVAQVSSTKVAHGQTFRTYFGTYTSGDSASEGIYTAVFDSESGTFTQPALAGRSLSPSFLAIDWPRRLLFAVNEFNEGEGRGNASVSAFRITADASLEFINSQETHGGYPCHLSIDGSGRFLLVANYIGGNVPVFPIAADGSLGDEVCLIQHEGSSVDPGRQQQPHAHSINLSSDNRWAYAADLGTDQIKVYQFDDQTGQLTPADPAALDLAAGGGPRHFDFHPSERLAFTNHELTAMVSSLRRDPASGQLTEIETVSTLPDDFQGRKSTAECRVHPSGRFLYVSNRGHDSIASYQIDQDSGKLTLTGITASGGEEPRNFTIDPTGKWLIAANQNSDTVVVLAIDPVNGSLQPTGHSISVGKPVCVRMIAAE